MGIKQDEAVCGFSTSAQFTPTDMLFIPTTIEHYM